MFADKLKELRNKEGISQSALGKALNMSQQGIAKWETGSTSPNPEMLRKIADYFNVSVDYLLGNTDIKKAPSDKPEVTDDDIQFALFGGKVDDETYEDVKRFAAFIKAKKEEQKKEKE